MSGMKKRMYQTSHLCTINYSLLIQDIFISNLYLLLLQILSTCKHKFKAVTKFLSVLNFDQSFQFNTSSPDLKETFLKSSIPRIITLHLKHKLPRVIEHREHSMVNHRSRASRSSFDRSKIQRWFNFHHIGDGDFALNRPLMQFAGTGLREGSRAPRQIDFWQRRKEEEESWAGKKEEARVGRAGVNKERGKSANKGICSWKSVSLLILTGTCSRRVARLNWWLGRSLLGGGSTLLEAENIVSQFSPGLFKLTTPFYYGGY